jgi:hypothetical protein
MKSRDFYAYLFIENSTSIRLFFNENWTLQMIRRVSKYLLDLEKPKNTSDICDISKWIFIEYCKNFPPFILNKNSH